MLHGRILINYRGLRTSERGDEEKMARLDGVAFSLAQLSRRASGTHCASLVPSYSGCRRQRQTHTTTSAISDDFFQQSDCSSDPAVSLLSRKSQLLPSEIHTCTAGSGRLASLRVEIETTQPLASSLERVLQAARTDRN
jgi:hypothetical protein